MSHIRTAQKWSLTSVTLRDAFTDFMLSRQAMNCTRATLDFYNFTAGYFLAWIEDRNVSAPEEVTARHVREYLALLIERGRKDTTVWGHARAIKTMLRFWQREGYIGAPVLFDLPKKALRRLPVLTAEQVRELVKVCDVRQRALVLFIVDSGLRREEVCRVNWADVDFETGMIQVRRGKGGKDRTAVIGARTRRALLAYRRTQTERLGAVFLTRQGRRMTGSALRSIFRRLSKRAGIHVNAHALRRTFVILSLRAGMSVLHLKTLLGHADFEMVERYAQLEGIDLVSEHARASPIDNL